MDIEFRFKGDWCHAGGMNGNHHNYGWPHVTGCVTYGSIKPVEVIATNCIYCGKEIEQSLE